MHDPHIHEFSSIKKTRSLTKNIHLDSKSCLANCILQCKCVFSGIRANNLGQAYSRHVTYCLNFHTLLVRQFAVIVCPFNAGLWLTFEWYLKGCGLSTFQSDHLLKLFVNKQLWWYCKKNNKVLT